jgi:hypothetical protein
MMYMSEYIDKMCLKIKENSNFIVHPIDIMGDKIFFKIFIYRN